MTVTDYEAILEQAKKDLLHKQADLAKCIATQEDIENEIAGLRGTVASLSRMLKREYVEEDEMGLTEAIRRAFKGHSGTLIPTEVRDRLKEAGYDISKHGNVMASIHSVMNRLNGRGEIIHAGDRADGKPAYRWATQR
jgi:hypothetical protein